MTSLRDAQVQELIAHNERLLEVLKAIIEGELIITRDDDMAELIQLVAQAEENGR